MYREYKAESFPEACAQHALILTASFYTLRTVQWLATFFAAQVEGISAPELQRLLEEQRDAVVLVDTRTEEERNVSIIPGVHEAASVRSWTNKRWGLHSAQCAGAISLPQFEEHCRAGIGEQRVVAYW